MYLIFDFFFLLICLELFKVFFLVVGVLMFREELWCEILFLSDCCFFVGLLVIYLYVFILGLFGNGFGLFGSVCIFLFCCGFCMYELVEYVVLVMGWLFVFCFWKICEDVVVVCCIIIDIGVLYR